MKLVLIVNHSPWGSTLAVTALRIARAALSAGHEVSAVFFRGEGVYNALIGTVADAGTPETAQAWCALADEGGFDLMVCQSSAKRRLNATVAPPFREAGLVQMTDWILDCDRVVTF